MTVDWSEELSGEFLRYAEAFEPKRHEQLGVISEMVGEVAGEVLDLCAGSGELSRRLLTDHPQCTVIGTDVSKAMLAAARTNLGAFGDRFRTERADLADRAWRRRTVAPVAVVSMLGLHLLDDVRKRELYGDLHELLAPGGRLVVADLVAPVGPRATRLAATMWDDWVRAHVPVALYQRFRETQWNYFEFQSDGHLPAPLPDQLRWLTAAGFAEVDVYWMKAGHAVFGGAKP